FHETILISYAEQYTPCTIYDMGMESFKYKKTAEKAPQKINQQESIDHRAYMQMEAIETDDFSCEFLRVRHTKETAEKYADELERFVANSEVLISELAVLEDREGMKDIEFFYRRISEMAEQAKVLMVVPDPEKDITHALLNRIADIAPASAAVASGLYVANKLSNLSAERDIRACRAEHNKKVKSKTSDSKLVSRREFLKMAAATTVAVAGGMSGAAGLLNEMHQQPERGGALEKMLLTSLDYRDACIAKEVLNRSKTSHKVSVIYGAGHYAGVRKYLENPKLLEERLQVYEKSYGILTPAQVAEYDYREKDGSETKGSV
ncbi:MAG: twin-arginine translocation signal domain-containing protein, partial [Patescibacteria group bacterium]